MKKISVTQRKSGELESDTVRTETARDSADLLHQSVLTSLYFDGQKDKTCSDHKLEGRVVIDSEPGSHCVTHFSCETGRAIHLLNSLHSVTHAVRRRHPHARMRRHRRQHGDF